MARQKRRWRRKRRSKRGVAYLTGGIVTGVMAVTTVMWRRFRPGRDNAGGAGDHSAGS